ncbi:MAG TPA: tetratricopeptide repeat protein [Dissulfurispiraceae bacterium]|nr:tetratricopeptide repeat protein [Dissulfurispiraceae bacterium]
MNFIHRAYRVCSLIVAAIVCVSVCPADECLAAPADPIRDAVVAITVRDSVGLQIASASGTVLKSDGLVATTCSVVTAWLLSPQNTIRIMTSDGNDMPMIDALSCNRQTNSALIRLPAEGLIAVTTARPSGAAQTATLLSRISRTETKTTALKIPRQKAPRSAVPLLSGVPEYLAGGPVRNSHGETIGIATFEKGTKTGLLVPFSTLDDQLQQYRRLQKRLRQLFENMLGPVKPSQRPLPAEVVAAQQWFDSHPNDAAAAMALGEAFENARMHEQAADAYRKALILNPGLTDARIRLGLTAFRSGNYREAAAAFEEVLLARKDSAGILTKLSAAYLALGEYGKSVNLLTRAAELEPENAQIRYNLGVAHFLNGNKNGAMEQYLFLNPLDVERAKSLFDLVN